MGAPFCRPFCRRGSWGGLLPSTLLMGGGEGRAQPLGPPYAAGGRAMDGPRGRLLGHCCCSPQILRYLRVSSLHIHQVAGRVRPRRGGRHRGRHRGRHARLCCVHRGEGRHRQGGAHRGRPRGGGGGRGSRRRPRRGGGPSRLGEAWGPLDHAYRPYSPPQRKVPSARHPRLVNEGLVHEGDDPRGVGAACRDARGLAGGGEELGPDFKEAEADRVEEEASNALPSDLPQLREGDDHPGKVPSGGFREDVGERDDDGLPADL